MQLICNVCKEESKHIYWHIQAKIGPLLEIMPKIKEFQYRIDHFENELIGSDFKMKSKINNLIEKKIV